MLYALEKLGIASRGDVLFTDYRTMPYGNVTLLRSTEQNVPVSEYKSMKIYAGG